MTNDIYINLNEISHEENLSNLSNRFIGTLDRL